MATESSVFASNRESPSRTSDASRFAIQTRLRATDDCICFGGWDQASDQAVEIRHLSAHVSAERIARWTRRLKLVELLDHPASRRLIAVDWEQRPLRFVLEPAAVLTLATIDFEQDTSSLLVLTALRRTAEALLAAHSLGLQHGDLRLESIGIEGNLPRLDFAAAQLVAEEDSAADRVRDVLAFIHIVEKLLNVESLLTACKQWSMRETAKLRQFALQASEGSTDELPSLEQLLHCLQAIENLGREAAKLALSGEAVQTTSHLAPPPITDGTQCIQVAPAANADFLPRALRPGDRLGRFRIESKLGQGGMGSVFKAVDLSTGSVVAIKVLSIAAATNANSVRRFQKESRMLASVNNPHITNLIEFNDEGGLHYIVLEFVNGVTLKQVLHERKTIPENEALELIANVARGLLDAHQREIIHLDIKPENILLSVDGTPKLTDFGVARFINQSESLALTQAGAMIGTPLYMSPEQFRGREGIRPQSDIYSLGVTLFEMLTGRLPFVGEDSVSLGTMHAFDPVPSLLKLNPLLSEAAIAIVNKCLAKHPSERFADAGHLLTEIDRLLRGEPTDVRLRPALPAHDARKVVGNVMEWQLSSPPEELWPYVVNTERLNRAIGLPAVEYTNEWDEEHGTRRFGSIRIAGIKMSWEEHPFEWIEGKRMSVLRQFDGGLFEWFVSTVELQRTSQGTRLIHSVKIAPRNLVGRWIAGIETGAKCQRALDKAYQRIDQFLLDRHKGMQPTDAFEGPQRLAAHQRTRLAQRTARLIVRGVDANVAEALGTFLTESPPQELAKIRPLALSQRLQLHEQAVIDACLIGASEGLLKLEWDVLCPTCRVAADSQNTLKQLAAHTHCVACHQDFQTGVAGAVELVFRVHPELRETDIGRYCIGGPWHAPHVVAQLRLEPGERLEVELTLPVGEYLIRGPRLAEAVSLRVQTSGGPSQYRVPLDPSRSKVSRAVVVRAGQQVLILENKFTTQQIVRIERTIPRGDVLTAAMAAALPRFRELFPGEVLESGRLVSAENVTLLAVGVPAVQRLYDELGDAAAFAVVQSQLQTLEQHISRGHGEVVKIIGEGILATFGSLTDAVQVAFELPNVLAAADGNQLVRPAIGVHRGPALVTTVNGRLDYFGAAVRQVLALPTAAGEGVSVTECVFGDPLVAEWLAQRSATGELRTIALPGRPAALINHWKCDLC